MPWIIKKKFKKLKQPDGTVDVKVTCELRHFDTEADNQVYHVLTGAVAESSMQAYCDKLNAENKQPPRIVKCGCDGFNFKP